MKVETIGYVVNESTFALGAIAGASVHQHAVCSSEDNTAVLTLSDNGTIIECNNAAGVLLGCAPSRLTWQHISTILPKLAEIALMQDKKINPNLRLFSRIGYAFEVIGMTGAHFASVVFFNEIENSGRHFLRVILRPVSFEHTFS